MDQIDEMTFGMGDFVKFDIGIPWSSYEVVDL